MSNIGLQLYSIKELCSENFFSAIEKVAAIGYDGVEFAGFFNTPARELKKVMDGLGIKPCGSHTGIDLLEEKLEEVIEYNLEIDNRYIICPFLPLEMRNSANAWEKTAELFNNVGFKLKENNLQFGYHNHAFEFEKFDGNYGYDILASNTQPDLVQLEIDTFWVEYTGVRAVDFMNKYPDRLSLIHLKDMEISEDKISTEVGNGIMDFKEIIMLAKKLGTKWYIVEQEDFKKPHLESIKESLIYIRALL